MKVGGDHVEIQCKIGRSEDATETASGTVKMNGDAQGLETTQAEAETHFHWYFLA